MTRRPASCASSGGKKTACGACGNIQRGWYDRKTRRVRDLPCGDTRIYLELEIRRVHCGTVKQEQLDWLAEHPFYTKRFAFFVGRRCRSVTIKDVAEETRLDWKTIKNLDTQYMREQLRRAGKPTPKVVGIDEISIRKGHTYRIVVSDLQRRRPIWFGGQDRSEASMDQFYLLLKANSRLSTAYILKEEFGQLWDYKREGWARRFFENWRGSLKWQRLKPYEKFAEMIDRHWDGIAAYCQPENKVALGFVEGVNNKIRVIQRRSYGLRDEEYLRLKVLTCMLDPI